MCSWHVFPNYSTPDFYSSRSINIGMPLSMHLQLSYSMLSCSRFGTKNDEWAISSYLLWRAITHMSKCDQMYFVSLFACQTFIGSLWAFVLRRGEGGKVKENNGPETWHGEVGRKTGIPVQVFKEHKEQFISKLSTRPIPPKLCHKWRRRAKAIQRDIYS